MSKRSGEGDANAGAAAIHTIVVGGGQAGLCMSHCLSQQGIDHLVLERARVGERWRSERWDSLRFQFPSRYVRLPGFDYDGDRPDAFMTRDEIVRVLERYAAEIEAPMRCGVNVQSLQRDDDGLFRLETGTQALRAHNVVLATGPYQRTAVPALSTDLPTPVTQLPASAYTNAAALPAGGVLVVGAGGSGVQIAEDLLAAGRKTYLSVGQHRRIPRRYRGHDVIYWFDRLGLIDNPVPAAGPRPPSPLLTGIDGGYDVDLRRLVKAGGHLLGRLESVQANELVLGDNLLGDIAAGDQSYRDFVGLVDAYIAEHGLDLETLHQPGPRQPSDEPARIDAFALDEPEPVLPENSPQRLDLKRADINSVIWATGYELDFSWIHCSAFDSHGAPQHERGVCKEPGLYVLGLPFLHSVRSTLFWGVAEDAHFIATHLHHHRAQTPA